jgi:hypothetical protein
MIFWAMLSNGTTQSTAPQWMASLGMPKTTQVCSSWAILAAPAECIQNLGFVVNDQDRGLF